MIPVLSIGTWETRYAFEGEVFDKTMAGVYFIQAGTDGPVKIGRSSDIGGRFDELQCANYEELYIRLICCPANPTQSTELERWFHSFWAADCLRGEWFDPNDDLLEWIDDPLSCWTIIKRWKGVPKDLMARSLKNKEEQKETWAKIGIGWD